MTRCKAAGDRPVESERVQKCRKSFHQEENGDRQTRPRREEDERGDTADVAFVGEAETKHHVPQHFRQLCSHTRAATCTSTKSRQNSPTFSSANYLLYRIYELIHNYSNCYSGERFHSLTAFWSFSFKSTDFDKKPACARLSAHRRK